MKHHVLRYIIMVAAILLASAGCKSGDEDHKRAPQAADSLYTAAYAMTFVDTEPERALQLIDSARLAGNLSDVRADIQRARVYGRSYTKGTPSVYKASAKERKDLIRIKTKEEKNKVLFCPLDVQHCDTVTQ